MNAVQVTKNAWMKMSQIINVSKNKYGFIYSASSGGCNGFNFELNLLEKNKIKAAFLVAGFCSLPENEFKEGMRTFVKQFNYKKIKENYPKFYIFHSDNDPYVPLEKAEELKEKLGGELIVVPSAGHFNSASGYDKFELLLEKIKTIL